MKHSSINKVTDYQAAAPDMSLGDWEEEEQYADHPPDWRRRRGRRGLKRPQRPPHHKDFSWQQQDRKIIVDAVDKNMANKDIQAEFEVYGQVVDAYNAGNGLASVTFDRKEDASAAIARMDGCGQRVTLNKKQINVAGFRPRGDGGGGRGVTQAGGQGYGQGREAFRRQVRQITDKNQVEIVDKDPFDDFLSGLDIQDFQ